MSRPLMAWAGKNFFLLGSTCSSLCHVRAVDRVHLSPGGASVSVRTSAVPPADNNTNFIFVFISVTGLRHGSWSIVNQRMTQVILNLESMQLRPWISRSTGSISFLSLTADGRRMLVTVTGPISATWWRVDNWRRLDDFFHQSVVNKLYEHSVDGSAACGESFQQD